MKLKSTLAMMAVATGAFAQTAAPTGQNKVVISQGQPIAAVVATLAKAANVEAVVDPSITGNATPAVSKLTLEPALTSIATANHVQWRRVYLKEAEIPRDKDGKISVSKLRQMVEAVSAAPEISVGVFDPATGTIAMSTRTAAASPATQEWLKARKPVYLLYRPTIMGSAFGNSGDPVGDYLTTQRNSLDAFRNMTPEQRSQAMSQGIEQVLNMDPEAMGEMMQQSMAAVQNLSPEVKAKLMDISIKMMTPQAKPKQ
ncbi:MAG TPA: hypothetical protein VGM51_05065 [Armatimonadota bacterium]|jgi:hypothetical protein